MAQRLKHLPAMWETWVWSLGREDCLEKEMATHSSILAWEVSRTEEPGGLQSTESQSRTRLSDFTFTNKENNYIFTLAICMSLKNYQFFIFIEVIFFLLTCDCSLHIKGTRDFHACPVVKTLPTAAGTGLNRDLGMKTSICLVAPPLPKILALCVFLVFSQFVFVLNLLFLLCFRAYL